MQKVHPTLPPTAPWKLGFLFTVVWIVALSLCPFDFSGGKEDILDRLRAAFDVFFPQDFAVALVHFLGFAAMGFLGYKAHQPWLESRGKWQILIIIAVGCAALEAAKLWIPLRHAMAADLAVKILGATAGAVLATWTAQGNTTHRWFPRLAAVVAGMSLAAWGMVGLKPLFGEVRLDWNPGFRLIVGNEGDGSRPWDGEVSELALFDRALNAAEIRSLQTTDGSDALVSYQLSRNSGKPAAPGGKLAAESSLVMATNIGTVGGSSYLATPGPAEPLTRSIIRSGAFTVAAKIDINNTDQTGPARIVGISKDSTSRNFSLGQKHDELVLRVANGANGPNGTRFALQQKALAKGPQNIVAIYDQGYSEMFVNGVRLPETIDLREPWYYLPVGKGAVSRGAVLLIFVFSFIVPASFAIRMWIPGIGKALMALVPLYFLGCLPFAICCLAGGPWNPAPFVGLLLATVTVAPLSIRYLGHAGT